MNFWQQMADLHQEKDLNQCIVDKSNIVYVCKTWHTTERSMSFSLLDEEDKSKSETNWGKQMSHIWQLKEKG